MAGLIVERAECCDCRVINLAGLVISARKSSANFGRNVHDDESSKVIRQGRDSFSVLCSSSQIMLGLKSGKQLCPDCNYWDNRR